MKPSEIFDILDLAAKVRENGEVLNPLFISPPGLGKSHITAQWAKKNGYEFMDIRSAYLEAPDVRGFPFVTLDTNGRQRTNTATPSRFPDSGKGVFFLDEVNRGPNSVMNCWMQILTDRKIDDYVLPEGWIVVAAINPEGGKSTYDTNSMDPALLNRFVHFEVGYDKQSFVDYMKMAEFHKDIINWVEAGLFSYKSPDEIGNAPGTKYVSPRTLSQLNSTLKTDMKSSLERMVVNSILGTVIGKDFYDFRHNNTPVMMHDLDTHLTKSLAKLEKYADPNNCQNGLLSLTLKDIVEVNTITDEMLASVILVLPVEKGTVLLEDLRVRRNDPTLTKRIATAYPKIAKLFKTVIKYQT